MSMFRRFSINISLNPNLKLNSPDRITHMLMTRHCPDKHRSTRRKYSRSTQTDKCTT
jgi:hypothetical protein